MGQKIELSIIAAVARNGVIGAKGEIPWAPIPEDMKRFRRLTLGKPVIMGRVTYESIIKKLGKPLDERINIVISSSLFEKQQNVVICDNPFTAMDVAMQYSEEAWIIGGGRVYSQTIYLPHTVRLEITELEQEYVGNVCFPYIDLKIWTPIKREPREGYDFVTYERVNPSNS